MTAPLTPSDCDLRDFPFMPLDVMRLRRSRAWLLAKRDPALAFYLINLWSASWHEVPAGSLEDDDLVLADLAMCDADTWERIRDTVLRGWVKCSDGRLYHPVVAEKARDAWQRKQEQRQRTEAARAARAAKRQQATVTSETPPQSSVISTTSSVTEIATDNATTSVTASKGQGQGQYREERKIPSFQDGRDLAPPDLPPDVQKALWGEGLEACRRLGMELVAVAIHEGDETDARLWEIAENLHRAELTVQERADHIAEWVRLTGEKAKAQVAPLDRPHDRGRCNRDTLRG